jgi:replication-associated recombination protein RarA
MDKFHYNLPLSEHFRPISLLDLTLPDHETACLQRMLDSGNVANMIFYGPPGTGKTSAARIIANEIDADVFNVDGANERSGKIILNDVPDFVRTMSMFGKPKLVVIDEGEFMTRKDQVSLRTTIEESYANCRFIVTTNDLKRIDRAIQSRMVSINFSVSLAGATDVVNRLTRRFAEKMDEMKRPYDLGQLRGIITMYFPDFRQTLNQIELRFS